MLIIRYISLFILLFLCGFNHTATAQCTSPVNVFPYIEDFEANDGGWMTGTSVAVPSDWEWGTPVASFKTVISSAASGAKCWIAGGLAKNSYNDGERSWLQSPCFDISPLTDPEISFNVFWETEKRFDGAGFQYSIDNGTNWNTLGSINSNNVCDGVNWFNYDPINFLGGPGWSGNIQSTSGSCLGGGGSGTWLRASHKLNSIAASSVIFRFTFAAGTTCNNYDGFAIDNIRIGEAAANSADFQFVCSGNTNVIFTGIYVGCKTGVVWNFGDPASGASNTSTQNDPSHNFSTPGNYTISQTTNFVSGPPAIITKDIIVLSVTAGKTNIICNGSSNGAISLIPDPPGTYNYTWDTNPAQTTSSISNLAAGTYTAFITGTNTCSKVIQVTITEPAPMVINTAISDARCGSGDGSVSASVTGGAGSYSYLWSNGSTGQTIIGLSPGIYSLQVTDINGCIANAVDLEVKDDITGLSISLGNDTLICPGQILVLTPGQYQSYQWQDNSSSPDFTVTETGVYSVTVTDNAGCMGTASIKVTVDCSDIYFPSAITPNGDTRNDLFGPLGSVAAVKNYKLIIFGRWGEVVFSSTDPYKKWNGNYKVPGSPTQTLVWTASYTINSLLPVVKSGTITVIR